MSYQPTMEVTSAVRDVWIEWLCIGRNTALAASSTASKLKIYDMIPHNKDRRLSGELLTGGMKGMVSGGPIGCRSVVSVKGDPWRNKLRHGVGQRVQAGAAGKWNSFVGRSARAQQKCNICNLDSLLIYAPSSNAHRWFLRCTYTQCKASAL